MSAPVCPCCGQPWVGPKVDLAQLADAAKLSRKHRSILGAFGQTPGRAVFTDDLATRLYADDPEGGPLDANATVRVLCCHIRKKIRPLGWTLTGRGGNGNAYYTLERVDA